LSKIVPSAKNTPNIVNKTATPATTISNPTTLTNTKETLEHAKRKLDFEEEKENQQQKKDSAKQKDETTDVDFNKLISKSLEKLQETENQKEQKNRQILLSFN